MSDAVVISLISLVGTLGGSFGGIMVANKLTNYRVEQLEKKVEKHNTIIERTYRLEKVIAVLENKEKVSEHRLDDLEKG